MIWRPVRGSRLAVGSSTNRRSGLLHQCPGDADPLTLAAGQGIGAGVLIAGELHPVEDFKGGP